MEKKYLVAQANLPMMGRTQVVFDDVKDLEQTDTRLAFTDKDGRYEFEKTDNLWHEVNDRAPDIEEVKIIGRRTARRHDLVGDNRIEANADNWREVDDEARDTKDFVNILASIWDLPPFLVKGLTK